MYSEYPIPMNEYEEGCVIEWFSAKEIYVTSSSNFFCGNSLPIMENRGAGRRGRRRKQLLDDLKKKR